MDATTFATIVNDVSALLSASNDLSERTANGRHDDCVHLTLHADGLTFGMQCNSWGKKNRIVIYPAYPRHKRVDTQAEEGFSLSCTSQRDFERQLLTPPTWEGITVDETTPANKIAAHIRSRFLPIYRPLWEKCTAWVAQQEAYCDSTRSTAERAKSAAAGQSIFSVRETFGDTVRFQTVSMSIEHFERICAFLKGAK